MEKYSVGGRAGGRDRHTLYKRSFFYSRSVGLSVDSISYTFNISREFVANSIFKASKDFVAESRCLLLLLLRLSSRAGSN